MPTDGVYEEKLPCGGSLKVTKSSWLIEYYFSGPDMRYSGTLFTIHQREINNFIVAFKANWDKYCQLKNTIPKGGEFTTEGQQGMQIRVGGYWDGVSIQGYHMP